jgi:hypothetical protein
MSAEERRTAAEAWLARAADDLRSARVRFGHPAEMTAEIAAFHAQQAADPDWPVQPTPTDDEVRRVIDVADRVVGAVRRGDPGACSGFAGLLNRGLVADLHGPGLLTSDAAACTLWRVA